MWTDIFSQHERVVNPDNTVHWITGSLQIEKTRWRNTLAGCTVGVYEHLDGTVVVRYGPHEMARWVPDSSPTPTEARGTARPWVIRRGGVKH